MLDTLERRCDQHRYYSSSGSDRNHDHRRHHPYRKSDSGCFLDEFKKEKKTTFDGEMKKS